LEFTKQRTKIVRLWLLWKRRVLKGLCCLDGGLGACVGERGAAGGGEEWGRGVQRGGAERVGRWRDRVDGARRWRHDGGCPTHGAMVGLEVADFDQRDHAGGVGGHVHVVVGQRWRAWAGGSRRRRVGSHRASVERVRACVALLVLFVLRHRLTSANPQGKADPGQHGNNQTTHANTHPNHHGRVAPVRRPGWWRRGCGRRGSNECGCGCDGDGGCRHPRRLQR